MTMIVNVSKGTRHIGGKTLAPSEMADVNMPTAKLKDHLFVRCGDIEVSERSVAPGKGKGKSDDGDSE